MPSPTLPADCRVETLAAFLHAACVDSSPYEPIEYDRTALEDSVYRSTWEGMARAVRALVAAKVREALTECPIDQPTGEEVLTRVLGSPS